MTEASGSRRVGGPPAGPGTTRPGGQGHGPTRVGAPGTGLDGAVAGATLLLALYGLVVIVVDLVANKKLLIDSGFAVAGIIVGCLVVGAVVGGAVASRSDR